MVVSFLTVLSHAADAVGLYSFITGGKTTRSLERLTREMDAIGSKVEHLAEQLLYAPALREIKIDPSAYRRQHAHDVREMMAPVQRAMGSVILATEFAAAPERFIRAMRDPAGLLFDIRPIGGLLERTSNSDAIPIVFMMRGRPYVGWQMRSALKYGFDYDPVPATPKPQTRSYRTLPSGDVISLCVQCGAEVHGSRETMSILCWSCQKTYVSARTRETKAVIEVSPIARKCRSCGRTVYVSKGLINGICATCRGDETWPSGGRDEDATVSEEITQSCRRCGAKIRGTRERVAKLCADCQLQNA